ncbi:MAG: carboxypeptidase regulatory-like domain-containing protein [Desulfobacteraceae bacterium]|nr:carboxypeptidase regulatory-like domain-containing protein [Desulfobacteraceae bacterium]
MKKLNVKSGFFGIMIVLFLAFLITGTAAAQATGSAIAKPGDAADPMPIIAPENFVTVSGVVKDSDGNPVPGVWVNAEPDYRDIVTGFIDADGNMPGYIPVDGGETDENGAFSLSVADGYSYDLFVGTQKLAGVNDLGGYFVDADGGSGTDAGTDGKWSGTTTNDWSERTVTEVGPDGISDIAISLRKGTLIFGKALDSKGTPVKDLWIGANSDEAGGWGGISTDDEGNFSIVVPPGKDYRVDSWPWNGGYAGGYWKAGEDSPLTSSGQDGFLSANWEDFTSVDATSDVEINIIFETAKTISGRVTDKAGDPVPDVWVSASGTAPYMDCCAGDEDPVDGIIAPHQWFGSSTDKDGNYEIAVYPAPDYRVSVDGNGVYKTVYYKDVTSWEDATWVDVTKDSATGIDFVLDMGKSISGTVLGLGADNIVHIEVWSDSSRGWGNARVVGTGSDVGFKVRGLEDGSDYRINVWAEGYLEGYVQADGTVGSWDKAGLFTAGADDVKIKMDRGASISGTISGLSAGDHVWIEAWSEQVYCMQYGEDGTQYDENDNGIIPCDDDIIPSKGMVEIIAEGATAEYAIDGLAYTPNFRVSLHTDAYISGYYGGTPGEAGTAPVSWDKATPVSTVDGDVSGVNIAMSIGNTISGVIKGLASGDYARISALSYAQTSSSNINAGPYGSAEVVGTGSDVAYEIKCLGSASDFRVSVHAKGYIGGFYSADGLTTDWENASLLDSSANPDNINMELSLGKTISGTITGLGKGEWAWIDAYRETIGGYTDDLIEPFMERCDVNGWCDGDGMGGDSWGSVSVEGTGSPVTYTISGLVAADDFVVTFRAEGYAPDVKTGVDSSTDPTDIDFAATEGKHISGSIKGVPDQWVSVSVHSETLRNGGYAHVQADSEGNAVYEIKGLGNASDYIVSAWADRKNLFYNQQMSWDDADKVDLTNNSQDNIDFDFSIIKMYTLTGSVAGVDENTFIWIDAWSENTGSWGYAEVKGNENFKMELLAGSYKIGIYADGYLKQFYNAESGKMTHKWEDATPLSVTADTDIGTLTFLAGNSISGKVTNSAGDPVAGAWIDAYSENSEAGAGAMTDENGTYRIGGLPDGTYTITAWTHEGGYTGEVTINGTDVTHDIVLGDADLGGITGNFTDDDDYYDESEDDYVFLFDSDDMFVNAAETDDSGDYSFEGLEAGDYTVKVRNSDDTYEVIDNIIVNP